MQGNSFKVNFSKYFTVVVFFIFSAGALLVFGFYTLQLVRGMISSADIVEFNKGAMYMLGVALSSGLLTAFMVHELRGGELSAAYNKKATQLALLFLGLIFIFPQATDYLVTSKLTGVDYVYCKDQSYRWLHSQNKVFAVNAAVCANYSK